VVVGVRRRRAAFLLLSAAQTEVSLELGARLLAADRRRKRATRGGGRA